MVHIYAKNEEKEQRTIKKTMQYRLSCPVVTKNAVVDRLDHEGKEGKNRKKEQTDTAGVYASASAE